MAAIDLCAFWWEIVLHLHLGICWSKKKCLFQLHNSVLCQGIFYIAVSFFNYNAIEKFNIYLC